MSSPALKQTLDTLGKWLFARKYYAIVFFLIIFLATGAHVEKANHSLATHDAPNKIVSLELAWTKVQATRVLDSWDSEKTPLAISSVWRDYLFIVGYTISLMGLVLIIRGYVHAKEGVPEGDDAAVTKKRRLEINYFFFGCCAFAAVGDFLENGFMLWALYGHPTAPFLYSFPATLKFVAVGALLIYLIYYLVKSYHELLLASWLYLPGVMSVVVSYFVFTKLTQGQDVLMRVGEYPYPFFYSVITIAFWSSFTWYSSRLVGYVKSVHGNSIDKKLHLHFPRVLAFNAYVSIQAAILALPTLYNWTVIGVWVFVIIQNVFYFVASAFFSRMSRPNAMRGFLFIVSALGALYIGYLIYVGTPYCQGHQRRLPFLAALLFFMQVLQMWLFIYRRRKMDERTRRHFSNEQKDRNLSVPLMTILGINIISVPERFAVEEKGAYKIFLWFSIPGIILYVTAIFSPELADCMGPLAITLLSLGILTSLANAITTRSIHYKISLGLLIFILAVLIGMISDPYRVRLRSAAPHVHAKRPTLEKYFKKWVAFRETKIRKANQPYPVYLVIADGGASRSGYWVASVLSAMQDSSLTDGVKGDYFSDHLLCLAGASGGSVGTATFYSLLKDKIGRDSITADYQQRSAAFLRHDFLSPAIARLLGSDLFRHWLPFVEMDDRAAALEKGFERFSEPDSVLKGAYKRPLSTVLDSTGRLPILFINTTNVQMGSPAVISSVHLESFSRRMDVLDLLDSIDDGKDMHLSTAVVMGARFPYVSPAGKIGKEYFVDGGYFDNTGSAIVNEMVQYLDSLKEDDPVYQKIRLKILHVSNAGCKKERVRTINPVVNDLAAPLLTLFGTYEAQTTISDHRLETYLKDAYKLPLSAVHTEINLYETDTTTDMPMNWVISNYNLDRMDERVHAVRRAGFVDACCKNVKRKKNLR
ncbi:MAG TPA: patatin-like phospholipase family protein [Cyclobacteriaceae bacterium]|jgi:hypothetical protein|nr:patatin-like phospholipase family protein [Cyclobacteriaceae bacterium]